MKLQAATLTDPGRERKSNEDRVWSQVYVTSEGETTGLFIVCDGVGGHLGGESASHWAVETVRRELSDLFCPSDPRETLFLPKEELDASLRGVEITRISETRKLSTTVVQAIQKANQVVYEYGRHNPEKAGDLGTTITLALVVGNSAIIANVGDSRTYLLNKNHIEQITKDHSLVATLVASGQIKSEDIYTHPQRNMIYRSLGNKSEAQVDTFQKILQPGDFLLLCSDGLWEMVRSDDQMARLVRGADSLEQACHKLVDAANTAGGNDNIGVVLVKVS
jgi:PPM family protein phosphatase